MDRRLDRRRVAAAVAGILLGAPTLKLRGDYLAIVTLGFGEIVRIVFRNLGDFTLALPAFLGGAILIGPNANLTGGNVGINPIDPPTIPIPGRGATRSSSPTRIAIASLYLVLALLVLTFFICVRLRDSKLGRAWMAIREDETAAAAMGINTVTTKLLAFSLGRELLGLRRRVHRRLPDGDLRRDASTSDVSILVVVMIILGGIGSLRGVVIGAFAVQYVNHDAAAFLGDADPQRPDPGDRRARPGIELPARLQPGQLQLPDLRDRPGGDDDQAARGPVPGRDAPRPRCTASASPPR